jgi:hypothetical protein
VQAQALRFIILAQICFLAGLFVAILLKPAGLSANDGISFYGIYTRTIVPYLISLLGAAFLYWRAARVLTGPNMKLIKLGLIISAILTVVIAATPYSVNSYLGFFHASAGSSLFSLQLLLSFWLVKLLRYDFWAILLLLVEFFAGIFCFIYLSPPQGLLIQFQIIFQIAFGGLLVFSLNSAVSRK